MPAQTGSIDLQVLNGVASYASHKTVTAYVEDYQGHVIPVTYECEVKAIIDGGNFYSVGSHDSNPETEYSRMGIAAEGMDYKFYSQLPPGIMDLITSFVFGQMGLHGDKIKAFGGHTQREEDDPEEDAIEGVKYKPYGEYGPDYIELGKADEIENADGTAFSGTHSPDRNIMRMSGGWVNKKDALQFFQHYKWEGQSGAWIREFYNGKPLVCRPAWEFAPGDRYEYTGYLDLGGIYANSRKDVRFTIPLNRPIADEVAMVEVAGTLSQLLVNGTTVVSASSPEDFADGASLNVYETEWGESGIRVCLRRDTAWSNGASGSGAGVRLTNLVINFY